MGNASGAVPPCPFRRHTRTTTSVERRRPHAMHLQEQRVSSMNVDLLAHHRPEAAETSDWRQHFPAVEAGFRSRPRADWTVAMADSFLVSSTLNCDWESASSTSSTTTPPSSDFDDLEETHWASTRRVGGLTFSGYSENTQNNRSQSFAGLTANPLELAPAPFPTRMSRPGTPSLAFTVRPSSSRRLMSASGCMRACKPFEGVSTLDLKTRKAYHEYKETECTNSSDDDTEKGLSEGLSLLGLGFLDELPPVWAMEDSDVECDNECSNAPCNDTVTRLKPGTIASDVTADEIDVKNARQHLQCFDVTGDGQLNQAEFATLMSMGSRPFSDEAIASLFQQADKDGNGLLDVYELAEFFAQRRAKRRHRRSKRANRALRAASEE